MINKEYTGKDPMDKLQYSSSEREYRGVLVEVTDASVTVKINDGKGFLKIPKRMIISDGELALDQEVGFMMSFPEVLYEEPTPHYVKSINDYNKRRLQIQSEHLKK